MIKFLLFVVFIVFVFVGCGCFDDVNKFVVFVLVFIFVVFVFSVGNLVNVFVVSEVEQVKVVDFVCVVIEKYKLIILLQECLLFVVDWVDDIYNSVEVLENYILVCGGDLNIVLWVVILFIDKNIGVLQKDDFVSGEYVLLK